MCSKFLYVHIYIYILPHFRIREEGIFNLRSETHTKKKNRFNSFNQDSFVLYAWNVIRYWIETLYGANLSKTGHSANARYMFEILIALIKIPKDSIGGRNKSRASSREIHK